ncbi:MAG: hypothetical protein ABIZ91_03640 [Gemmatimonadaceae bacterium]
MGIEFLDPDDAADVDHVAALYEEYLATSPVVKLGPRFLREFFFSQLVRDDLLGCLVCRVDGKVIAFLSWTNHPSDFVGRGIKRHFVSLAWIMVRSIAARPVFLRDLLHTMRMVSRRAGDSGTSGDEQGVIEAISIVVPPAFQKHVPPGGKSRVTVRLVQTLAEHARGQGVTKVLYVVQPTNMSSCMFFNGMGCDFEKRTYAGEDVYVYTHDLLEAAG